MTDPFSTGAVGATATDDPFDVATSEFIEPADIDGRLILAIPYEVGSAKGTNGEPYDYVICDMLVLDGPATDKIPGPFPFEVKGQRFQSGIIAALKPRVAQKRMTIGRVHSQTSKYRTLAYRLVEPTDDDIAKAKPIALSWIARRVQATDPFASA